MVKPSHDIQRETMRRAHQHYRRMSARHHDWPFASSLRIEAGKARSVQAKMQQIAAAIIANMK